MTARHFSFHLRLTLIFGGLTLLLGLGVALFIDTAASRRMTQSQGEALQGIAQSIAHTLGADLVERQRAIVMLSQQPLFTQGIVDLKQVRQLLDRTREQMPEFAWLGLASPSGTVLAAAGGLLEAADVSERPWFMQGRHAAYIGDVHDAALLADLLPAKSDEPLRFVDLVAPVLDDKGKLQGVLGAHAHWSWVTGVIRSMLSPEAIQSGIEVLVADGQGHILYPRERVGQVQLPRQMPADKGVTVATWSGEGDYLSSVAHLASGAANHLGWQIVVRQSKDRALAAVHELERQLLLIGTLVAIVFMAITYLVAWRFSRPVVRIARVARRIEQGDEDTAFPNPSGIPEIRDLAESLHAMMTTMRHRQHLILEANLGLEHKVQVRTAELSDLYNNAPVGYHTADPEGLIQAMNDRELTMLGYSREEVVGQLRVIDLLAPACRPIARDRMARLKAGEILLPQDADMLCKDGAQLPVRLSSTAELDASGKFLCSRTAVMDVSRLRDTELALHAQQVLNEAIIHASANGLLLYRADGQCTLANEAAASMLGASVQTLLAQNVHQIASWHKHGVYEAVLATLRGQQTELTISLVSSFGKQVDAQLTLAPLQHEGQQVVLMVLKDISDVMAANRHLEQLARRDTLTGLSNRLALNERLREEFLRMKRSGAAYVVLLIDVDHFKRINDTYGHETGDRVLQLLGALLAKEARNTDFVARYGGEEFLILLPNTDGNGGRVLAEKIRSAVASQAMPPAGQVTLSIGLAVVIPEDVNEDVAVRRADAALYRAKASGRNRVIDADVTPSPAEGSDGQSSQHA
jgi:diguanylate cyclase (GGDEF)-like protein/PAS domain S-box-containing protein